MADTIDLGEVKISTKKAQRDLKALEESLAQIQKTATSGGGGSGFDEAMTRARQGVRGLGEAYQTAASAAASYARIASGVTAGVAAFAAVGAAMAQGAARAEDHRRAVERLDGAYERVRIATADTVTAQQALAAQQTIVQSGLRINAEQMGVVARAAREFALRTGTDTTEAMTRLSSALASGDAAALRPFGISVRTGTLRTQAFRQALQQLGEQQRGSSASATTMREEYERLTTSLGRLGDSLSSATASGIGLRDVFREMADAVNMLVDGGPQLHNFFTGILEDIIPLREATGGRLQARTADDRRRADEQTERENAISTLAAARQRFPGISTQFNANSLRGPDTLAFTMALSRAGSQREAESIIAQFAASTANRGANAAAIAADEAAAMRLHEGLQDTEERTIGVSEVDAIGMSSEQRAAAQQVEQRFRELRQSGIIPAPGVKRRLYALIGNFIDPRSRARFQAEMSQLEGGARGLSAGGFSGLEGVTGRYGAGLTNEQYLTLIAADRDKASADLADAQRYGPGEGGRRRTADGSETIFERYSSEGVLLTERYTAIAESEAAKREARLLMEGSFAPGFAGRRRTGDGAQSVYERYGAGLTSAQYEALAESEAGKGEARAAMDATSRGLLEREDLKTQLVGFFSDTETLAEKGAKGFTNAFQTMSGAVSGFVDALIEGQQPAGEAAIGLAKAALKGLAMQAVPEALFETAKGLAAVATGNPMAATHFAAAGVYTAVAVAAGGAAAGINAAQRGATPSAAASAAGPLGSTLPSSSGGGRDSRPIVINVNGIVMDREGYENAVLDGLNGALARGGRMAA